LVINETIKADDSKDINFEYELIIKSITTSYNNLIKQIPKSVYNDHNKFWFNEDLKILKKKKQIYKINNNNDPDYKEMLKKFKKESRKIQRSILKQLVSLIASDLL
jgi:predicted PurR-regulated permease PerM